MIPPPAPALSLSRMSTSGTVPERPNILFFHVDNLGFGELSCYSGGPFRGTWTRRIDAFAADGCG